MAEEIKKEQPVEGSDQNQPITLKEKIAIIILIGYVISLIWLAGSKYWYGIW